MDKYNKHKILSGGGVLPYIGYIGMCCAKWYGFLAVLDCINFDHFGLKYGMVCAP